MPGTMWLFLEGQIVQILGFVGHTVSVMTIHLCCQVMKMVIDNIETYNFDCVSKRLYLKKKKNRWQARCGWQNSLLTPVLSNTEMEKTKSVTYWNLYSGQDNNESTDKNTP